VPPPGNLLLCQNESSPGVVDCNASLIHAIRCAIGGPPLTNTDNEYARVWDLATEPGIGAGVPFEVTEVCFPIRILTVDPNVLNPAPMTVRIYIDLDTDGGGSTTPPANVDLVLLASKVVNVATDAQFLPCAPTPCQDGLFFSADFTSCPVSVPANARMVVGVEVPDITDLSATGGQITIGCTPTETAVSYQRSISGDCALGSFISCDDVIAGITDRNPVIRVVGRINQPVNLGACCDRSTGVCTQTPGNQCIGQFTQFTPCGPCIDQPDNCPVAIGSCCNDMTGVCTDGVNIAACVLPEQRFNEGVSCAALGFTCTSSQVNDACAQAVLRPIPSTTHGNTRFANPEVEPDCDPEAPGVPDDEVGGVWYRVQGTGQRIRATCCAADGGAADYDQKITIYCGTNCADLVCVNNPTDGDDACGTTGAASLVEWDSRANRQYWINVHGFPNPNSSPQGQGHFIMLLSNIGPAVDPPFCTPVGACCLNACGGCAQVPPAVTIDGPGCAELGGTFLGVGVTCDGDPCGTSTVTCCAGDNNGDSVHNGKDIAGEVAALVTPPACDTLAFCRADANEDGLLNNSDIPAFVGKLLNPGAGCADSCSTPVPLATNSVTIIDNNTATESPDDPTYSCYFSGVPNPAANTMWFSFVATHTSIRVNTCGAPGGADPSGDTLLAIREGACGATTELACAEDDCGATTFMSDLCATGLTVGNTYLLEVASFGDADAGSIRLELVSPASPVCP
jgi:hypothetical protein